MNGRIRKEDDYIDDDVEGITTMDWYTVELFNIKRTSKDDSVNHFWSIVNFIMS